MAIAGPFLSKFDKVLDKNGPAMAILREIQSGWNLEHAPLIDSAEFFHEEEENFLRNRSTEHAPDCVTLVYQGHVQFGLANLCECSAHAHVVPETKEAAKLGEAFLHASNHTNNLQISLNMPLKVHVLQSIQNKGHCVITFFYFQRVGHRNGCIFQTSVNQAFFDVGNVKTHLC